MQNERRYPAVEPVCLAIHLTYQCPLRCDHCCFSSDMTRRGALDEPVVRRLIDEAASLSTVTAVGFTGGDPFLQPATLEAGVAHARSLGLETRVVTSGYWATTPEKARRALEPLAAAGLDELCLSYDESHVAYLRERNIINAFAAADALGLKITIYMSTEPGDRIDGDYVRERLGADEASNPRFLLIESQVTTTGRADTSATEERKLERAARPNTYLGPCPSMLRQTAVTPEGKILPCCGTIPFREGLCIGETATTSVGDAMRRAYADDLYRWIAFEGPAAVLVQATEDTEAPLTLLDFDGICHACDTLFSSETYQALARAALEKKRASLQVQEAIFAGAGLYNAPEGS